MTGGGPRLSEGQRLNWLRLIRTPNVGPATFRDLINRFGSAEAAIERLPALVSRFSALPPRIPTLATAMSEMATAERIGARFAAVGEPDYPAHLMQIEAPPPLIAVRGNTAVLGLRMVAIVGARNASLSGMKIAQGLASDLGRDGYAIVSGLARGIDTAAHRGSLDTGSVAVLAGGLDRPYPPENVRLSEEICERGALVSEMPFGWEPRAQDFPRRNRLVAGMALGLVVVEAARRSGSLISARLAGEMGRQVFAVPGSPLDPRAEGTNRLLKDGAVLVTDARDVLETLAPMTMRQPQTFSEPADFTDAPEADDSARSRLLEALSPTPGEIDELIRHTGLHPAQVHLVLLELDLAGRLERHAGGMVSLLADDAWRSR
ncbi:MAG: DNA-processing protein DprA [Rhizobiaceae bacterium]|nr:DNA-processing protein DprA [Rhizobiaceae bacterium]